MMFGWLESGICLSLADEPTRAEPLRQVLVAALGRDLLVGNTGDFFNAIAFGPTGILYATTADLDNMGNLVNTRIRTLNPLNAQTISSVAINQAPGALGVRPDGVIFEGNGDGGGGGDPLGGGIYTVNPVTGAETLVGHTGLKPRWGLGLPTSPRACNIHPLRRGPLSRGYKPPPQVVRSEEHT